MDQYCNSDLVIPQSSEINPSSNGLFVKFKIPKTSFHDGDQNQNRRINLGGHPCHFCSKRFSSGKALGGHIRVHMVKPGGRVYKKKKKTHQSYLHSKLAVAAEMEEERKVNLRSFGGGGGGEKGTSHSCCLCSKEFRSMKSLFGHMRNHPERGWRGIRPPHPPPHGDGRDNNSCSSSTFSENELLQFHDTRMIDHETKSDHKAINEIPEAAVILMEMAYSGQTLDLGKLVGNPSFVYNEEEEEEEEEGADDDDDDDDDENEREKLGQMKEKKRKMEMKQLDFDLNQPYVVDGDQGTLAHN